MTDSFSSSELLWKPLFEAAAQTVVGAISGYGFKKIISHVYETNRFEGGMDVWVRGIHGKKLVEGDSLTIDGLISPDAQLSPWPMGFPTPRLIAVLLESDLSK